MSMMQLEIDIMKPCVTFINVENLGQLTNISYLIRTSRYSIKVPTLPESL